MQGLLPADEDPEAYLDIARAVKAATPRHAPARLPAAGRRGTSPTAAGSGSTARSRRCATPGVDTVPGTGVKVLSERVRALVAPGDLEIDRWVEGITAAHRAGFRSTSVLFYGHVETAAERIAHLRLLREHPGRDAAGSPSSCRSRFPGPPAACRSSPGRAPSTSTARWSPCRGCC